MTDADNTVADNVPVALEKILGLVNLLNFKFDNQAATVERLQVTSDRHTADIAELKAADQRIIDQANADKETALALALALKEENETRRNNASWAWTPFTRFLAVLGTISAVIGVFFGARSF